jgi:hypothetical protein
VAGDPGRRLSRAAVLGAVVVALAIAPSALADGDPASDVLPNSDVYFPYTPVAKKSLRQDLVKLLKQSRSKHYAVKVALIASPADLGAYASLMGHPRSYLRQLAAELGFIKKLHLLVIMPKGFAGYGLAKGWRRALDSVNIRASKKSNGLVRAALEAIPRLARVAGHPLPGT